MKITMNAFAKAHCLLIQPWYIAELLKTIYGQEKVFALLTLAGRETTEQSFHRYSNVLTMKSKSHKATFYAQATTSGIRLGEKSSLNG